MTQEEISYKIRGAIFRVYNKLGPGLLESVYESALAFELTKEGLNIGRQVPVPMVYEGQKLDVGFRIDILVESTVVVEIKSIETINPVHHKQLLTYLSLAKKRLGLLVNFNTDDIGKSIIRKLNGY